MQISKSIEAAEHTSLVSPTLPFSVLVAVAVLPLFASQTLLGPLSATFHVGMWATLVTASTMLGYAAGLFLLVPLLDRIPSRTLITRTISAQVICLALVGIAPDVSIFLAASFALGMATSVVQMLLPVAASLSAPSRRGAVVGGLMSALMVGILLSRPLASAIAGMFGWRMFFAIDAGLVSVLALLLVPGLPNLRPASRGNASLATVMSQQPVLRWRSAQQAFLMAGFSVFWGGVSVALVKPPFDFDAYQIALFALAGSAGVFAAPIAGRAGDKGHNLAATAIAHLVAIAGALLVSASMLFNAATAVRISLLAVAAFLLDAGVVADQSLGRREINLLPEALRGRCNGLYTGILFIGSSLGAAMAGPALLRFGDTVIGLVPLLFLSVAAAMHIARYFHSR